MLVPAKIPITSPGPVFGSDVVVVTTVGGTGVGLHWLEPTGYVWPFGAVQVGGGVVHCGRLLFWTQVGGETCRFVRQEPVLEIV